MRSAHRQVYHKDSNTLRRFNKVKPCSPALVLGWVTKYEYPAVLQYLFFPFFPFLFQGDIKDCRAVVSSIYQLFVPHFAMAEFMYIIV